MKTLLLHACVAIALFTTSLQAQVHVKLVKEINPGFSDSKPHSFAIAGGKLFFIAYDGTSYRLYVTEGDSTNTIYLGPDNGVSYSFTSITAFKNKVYFSFDDNVHGQELWVSDGTKAGTKLFKDIYPGATASFPYALTTVGNKLFFIADNEDGGRRMFASDGTVAGTIVVKNGYTDNFNGAPTLVTLNNNILFKGDNGTTSGYGLWISDGTVAGTTMLVPDIVPANAAGNSVQLNGKVYFSADDNIHGLELWASDGTSAGTKLVKNISPDAPGGGTFGNGTPQGFCVYKNKVYFSASDGEHGQELWVTNGTEAGTKMVKDITPGSTGSLPYHSIVYNNLLYTILWGPEQLWVSDGTEAGTTLVAPLASASQFAAIWNNLIYLESPNLAAVYQSDGTTLGTKPATADNTASSINFSSPDSYFAQYNGELYFSGNIVNLTQGYELVKLSTGALPLTLVSFTGKVQKTDDILTWQTATETNTAYFEVQQAATGNSFTKAGIVNASGNSNTLQTYTFNQNSAVNPGGYYRLKMVDKNGAFSYSNIIKLARTNKGELKAYYNNGGKQIIIQNPSAGVCNWQLYSAGGTLVKKGVSAGGNIVIPAGSIAGGVYILTCQGSNGNSKFTLPVF